MGMTIDEIETFVCIAGVGGFTEASTRLGRSQPAISRRIRELERSLGAPLFDRTGRRVALTEAGKALLPHAQAALAAVRDGEQAVRDVAGEAQALSVAIVGTLADSHIVDALRAFEARFPDAPVDLRTATSREVSVLVRTGEAALGLRYFPIPIPRWSPSRSARSGSWSWCPPRTRSPSGGYRIWGPSGTSAGSASHPSASSPTRSATCCDGSWRRPGSPTPPSP